MQSNTVLSSKVFSREGVVAKSKNNLSLSISFSQLYYNRHTASGSNATVTNGYKTIHMRIARSVAGQHKIPGFDVDTDAVVLAKACLPSAEVFQSLARLRYLGRLYVAAPDYLLALIELASKHKNGWFHLITRDICWLKSVGAAIPECPEELAGFIRASPERWKRLLKSTESMHIQHQRVLALAAQMQEQFFRRCFEGGVPDTPGGAAPAPLPAPVVLRFPSQTCGKSLDTDSKRISHEASVHHFRSLPFQYLNEEGLSCLKVYHTKARLFRCHLSNNKSSCLRNLFHFYQPQHEGPQIRRTKMKAKGSITHIRPLSSGAPVQPEKKRIEHCSGP